jgi:hypothetical protein
MDLSLIKHRLCVTRLGFGATGRITDFAAKNVACGLAIGRSDPTPEQTEADRLGIYLIRPSWLTGLPP